MRDIWGFLLQTLTASGAAVLLLTGLLVKTCNYLLVDDTSSYTRLTMHELYETADSGENIDTLFLGSSHCFRAYDPQLFTELTGKNSFNLGSSSQNYDTSYYLLREAARYNDLKTVYLDMHYKFLFIDKQDRDLVQANIISDYMRFSLNKLEFLLTTSETDEYTNRFLPFRRNWQQLGDLSYIRSVWEKKQAESYRNYEPVALEDEYYAGRGFVWSDAELNADEITWWDNFTDVPEDMANDSGVTYTLDYIERIVEFCREEGIYHCIRLCIPDVVVLLGEGFSAAGDVEHYGLIFSDGTFLNRLGQAAYSDSRSRRLSCGAMTTAIS